MAYVVLLAHFTSAGLLGVANQAAARRTTDRLLIIYISSLVSTLLLLPVVLDWAAGIDRDASSGSMPTILLIAGLCLAFGVGYTATVSLRLSAQRILPQFLVAPLVHLNILASSAESVGELGLRKLAERVI